MISIREMFSVFFGRKPMEEFASQRYSIFDGAVNYSIAFISTTVLLAIIYLICVLLLAFVGGTGMAKAMLDAAIHGAVIAVATILALVSGLAFSYIWGAVHFFLSKFYAGMPGSLNDFNGSWLSLMGSVTLVQRLLLIVPLIVWFAGEFMKLGLAMGIVLVLIALIPAILVHLYGVLLTFRFIKARLGMPQARAAIVVLVPIVVLMLALLVVAGTVMVVVGTKII